MRAVLLLTILSASLLVACGGDDAPSPTASARSTVSSGRTTAPAALNVDADKKDAFAALERQMKYLTDGQFVRAYDEIHPAQRELFTKEEYAACVRDAASVGEIKLKLREAYIEADMLIPGTTTRADALALTVDMTIAGDTDTNTFREFKLDGKWYFTVADPDDEC